MLLHILLCFYDKYSIFKYVSVICLLFILYVLIYIEDKTIKKCIIFVLLILLFGPRSIFSTFFYILLFVLLKLVLKPVQIIVRPTRS